MNPLPGGVYDSANISPESPSPLPHIHPQKLLPPIKDFPLKKNTYTEHVPAQSIIASLALQRRDGRGERDSELSSALFSTMILQKRIFGTQVGCSFLHPCGFA